MVGDHNSPTVRETFQSGNILFYVCWGLCVLFSVVLLWVVGPHILAHLSKARRPKGRFRSERKIQAASGHHINWYKTIILMSIPILAFVSIISVTFLKQSLLVQFFLVTIQSFVLTIFFSLLQEYLGGPKYFKATLRDIDHSVNIWATRPFCFLRRYAKPDKIDTPGKVLFCEIVILQIVVVRPALFLIALILQREDLYHKNDTSLSSSRLIIQYLSFISLVFCIYGLRCIYRAAQPILKKYNAGLQFLAVKLLFIFAVVQTLVLSFLAASDVVGSSGIFTGDDIASMIQSVLFTFELNILAVLFKRSFPVDHITNIESILNDAGVLRSNITAVERDIQSLPRVEWS
eukprot:Clim_evm22s84 gene=Clim_evmTU22s84